MASNWKTYSLGDIADIGSSKRIKMADYVSKGVPFFRSKEIIEKHKGNAISTELFITEEQFSSIKAKFSAPCEGDILLTSVGTLGVPYQVQCDDRFYFKDGNLTWFRNFKDVVNSRYIYFWLTSALAKRKIDEVTIGSTQQALTIVALKSITIDLPPISIQNEIIKHIDSISRKITLNRQINQTLEQMAQALFKSWFVDFDPVIDNALDAGNPIPDELQHRAEARKTVRESEGFKPLPENVRQLFPDAFEESELGWVPKGWVVSNLSTLIDIKHGFAFKGKYFSDKETSEILLTPGNVKIGGGFKADKFKYYDGPIEDNYVFSEGDMFVTMTDLSKASDTLGYPAIVPDLSGKRLHHNQRLGKVLFSDHPASKEMFVYHNLCSTNYRQNVVGSATGTTVKHTAPKKILAHTVVHTPDGVLESEFERQISVFRKMAAENDKSTNTLTKLRDTLLPKLISGELRLDDIELAVEQEAVSAEQQNER